MLNSKYDLVAIERMYLKEDKTADEIAKILNTTKKAIQGQVHRLGLRKTIPVTYDWGKMSKSDPVFNYLMGLAVTDGYVDSKGNRLTITLVEPSQHPLYSLASYYSLSTGVQRYRYVNGYRHSLTFPGQNLLDKIQEEYRFGSAKTFTKECPTNFESEDCLRMYLRGVVDGDGHVSVVDGRLRLKLYCGSEVFIDQLLTYVSKVIDGTANKRFMTSKGRQYPGFELTGAKANLFFRFIYSKYSEYAIPKKLYRVKQVLGEEIV